MEHTFIKRAVLIIFHIIGIYCSASQRAIERIRYLENRINSESKFRDEDYAVIIDRLDEIDKRLNASLEQKVGLVNVVQETNEVNLESVQHIREDLTRLRKAFREEKSETARIRREIPKIENNLISMKQDMDKYCIISLNKTEQLTTLFKEADGFIKNDIALQINEITEKQIAFRNEINNTSILEREEFRVVAAQIEENVRNTVGKTLNEINVEQKALRNDINNTSIFERQEFLVVTEKILEQVKINTEKIENIDMILTKLSTLPEDSCSRTVRTGVYKLSNGLKVFCDQTTDGGGWIVFQRRINGGVDFFRNWTEYKNGFGDLNGEFWLGNERLSILTATGDYELRIDMEDFEGNRAFAKYSKFKIYPEEDKYKLEVSGYSGDAGDSLEWHNGMAFSTFDNDNDKYSSGKCTISRHGAWWYNSCAWSNLNGEYFNDPCKSNSKGTNWWHWKRSYYCLKSVEMKFR